MTPQEGAPPCWAQPGGLVDSLVFLGTAGSWGFVKGPGRRKKAAADAEGTSRAEEIGTSGSKIPLGIITRVGQAGGAQGLLAVTKK